MTEKKFFFLQKLQCTTVKYSRDTEKKKKNNINQDVLLKQLDRKVIIVNKIPKKKIKNKK